MQVGFNWLLSHEAFALMFPLLVAKVCCIFMAGRNENNTYLWLGV